MIESKLISVEGTQYRIAMPLGAVSEVATFYPFLGKLQKRLLINDDGEHDFDALAAERVAKVALRWGGEHSYDDLPSILVAHQIALNALQMAFDISPEDEVKEPKKKAGQNKPSTSDTSSE